MTQFLLLIAALLAWYLMVWRKPKDAAERPAPPANKSKPERANAPLSTAALEKIDKLHRCAESLYAPALRGKGNTSEPAPLYGSRLGGPLLWTKGEPRPTDVNGAPLILLAQVALSSLPKTLDLPAEGLLQFLVGTDDLMGADGFPTTNGKGCLIVLHPADTELETHRSPQESDNGYSPFNSREVERNGMAIAWEPVQSPPPPVDYRLARIINDAPKLTREEENDLYDTLDPLIAERGSHDILLRGNPDFMQTDIRSADRWPDHVNLAAFSSSGSVFMWGDAGEACFLIAPEALAKGNLKQVLYSWDCS